MSIKEEIIQMVFGDSVEVSEKSLSYFTNPNSRKDFPHSAKIYKDGITRYPEINNNTGSIALYFNTDVLKESVEKSVIDILRKSYGMSTFEEANGKQLGLYHGPPSLIVKPNGSGISQPFIYYFQDLSEGVKYTVVKCKSIHPNTEQSVANGTFQKLEGFDVYFDLLNEYYDFNSRSKSLDIFYLDAKWFNIIDAQNFIEEYTAYYNYYVRDMSCELERNIRQEVVDIFDAKQIHVPREMIHMRWIDLDCSSGNQFIFDSKTVLRTQANRDFYTRIYIQIPIEPKPKGWDSSSKKNILIDSYRTGKFGNWAKPGLRKYLRDNPTESKWRDVHESETEREKRREFINNNKRIFAIE